MRALAAGLWRRLAGGDSGPPLLPQTAADLLAPAAQGNGGGRPRRRRRLGRREYARITANVVRVRSALTGAVEYRCRGSEPVVVFAVVLEAFAMHRGLPSSLMPDYVLSDIEADYAEDDPASFADSIASVIADFARRADLPSSEDDDYIDDDAPAAYDDAARRSSSSPLIVSSGGEESSGDDDVGAAHVAARSPPPLPDEERGGGDAAADVEGALGGGRGAPLILETGVHASQAAQRAANLFRLAARRARPVIALMPNDGAPVDDDLGVLQDTDIDPDRWYAVPPALYAAYELFLHAGVGDATLVATLDQWLHVANGGLDGRYATAPTGAAEAAAFVPSLFAANGGGSSLRRLNGTTPAAAAAAAASASASELRAELVDSLVRWYNERFAATQRMHAETESLVWRAEQLCATVRKYSDVLHQTALAAAQRINDAAEGDASMADGDAASQLLDALSALSAAVPAFEQSIAARAAATRAAFAPLAAFVPVVASGDAAAAAQQAASDAVAVDVAAAAAGVGLHGVTGNLTREMAVRLARSAGLGPKDADE